MATRDELIERIAAVMMPLYIEEWREPTDVDYAMAAAVLDAILPQVTTVEELEALPDGAKVLDESGDVWRKAGRWCYGTTHASCTVGWLALRPLTVVWRP